MNKPQKEIILELKKEEKRLNHSPRRREVPSNLWLRCYRYFGSFNTAKNKAGLSIFNIIKINFPKKAFVLDRDMAHIASYLTFDGHIYKSLRGMMFSSVNIKDLREIEKIFKRKFKIKGKYKLNSAGSHNQTHQFYIFNKKITSQFIKLKIPKGNKTLQDFRVPNWIKKSRELSKEYLKIAYLCEGSFKENDRKNPRISINIAKANNFLSSGLNFMNDIREMLLKFGIRTTDCHISGKNAIRKKDNIQTSNIRFRIITQDNNKFIKAIGWIK